MTTTAMTASQKIKHMILNLRAQWDGAPALEATAENIDALYDEADENDCGQLQDARNEIRSSGEDSALQVEHDFRLLRHYEAKEVAAKAPDGGWVGWTYWYGGGKHGEPEEIDWIDDAYDLNCVEEQRVVTVRTFTIPETSQPGGAA